MSLPLLLTLALLSTPFGGGGDELSDDGSGQIQAPGWFRLPITFLPFSFRSRVVLVVLRFLRLLHVLVVDRRGSGSDPWWQNCWLLGSCGGGFLSWKNRWLLGSSGSGFFSRGGLADVMIGGDSWVDGCGNPTLADQMRLHLLLYCFCIGYAIGRLEIYICLLHKFVLW